MPHYHFNVHDGASTLDREGMFLADISAARRQAMLLAGALLEADTDKQRDGRPWLMEVTNQAGEALFRLDFKLTTNAFGPSAL
ncbi:hypothetical protein FV232_27725 [Methylobacterium sp. WL30]|uniref:DUF6894 family protein n=1 Tax=unclassified Methylobacterium TaxID=2615210 RepID=UPI0011CC0223|nr:MULTISPECIES: hypothetical protein [unclassified Methylobacterium]RZL19862.1 MAG: hypothetical protein EOP64_10045 [Sphingomonas sp.]TXN39345.1 hypothetical protein FV225_10175 [Methylobacterium sp. WL93]TXM94899.1 hypothetical protein FV223_02855 [Methylobacterium sp. WL116]TXN45789.1 hypothetical protein FV227_24470 [Methylobacterium sp. WL119]TXN60934.1 hypothetical protein FV232_27725 [Methylobacterium sp. WL30]